VKLGCETLASDDPVKGAKPPFTRDIMVVIVGKGKKNPPSSLKNDYGG